MSKSVYLSEKLGVVLLPTRGIRAGLLDLDFQRNGILEVFFNMERFCVSPWTLEI